MARVCMQVDVDELEMLGGLVQVYSKHLSYVHHLAVPIPLRSMVVVAVVPIGFPVGRGVESKQSQWTRGQGF